MYLRTTRRTNKDGTTATYYQLAHNERNPDTGHTTARVIHNFGRDRDLERDVLVRLCQSIARVANLEVVDPLAEPARTVDRLAEMAAMGATMVEARVRSESVEHCIEQLAALKECNDSLV